MGQRAVNWRTFQPTIFENANRARDFDQSQTLCWYFLSMPTPFSLLFLTNYRGMLNPRLPLPLFFQLQVLSMLCLKHHSCPLSGPVLLKLTLGSALALFDPMMGLTHHNLRWSRPLQSRPPPPNHLLQLWGRRGLGPKGHSRHLIAGWRPPFEHAPIERLIKKYC